MKLFLSTNIPESVQTCQDAMLLPILAAERTCRV